MVKLKKEIKWRVEDGEKILICNCKRIAFFELPMAYLKCIEMLAEGTERGLIDGVLLDELKYIDLIDEVSDSH